MVALQPGSFSLALSHSSCGSSSISCWEYWAVTLSGQEVDVMRALHQHVAAALTLAEPIPAMLE